MCHDGEKFGNYLEYTGNYLLLTLKKYQLDSIFYHKPETAETNPKV